MYSYSYVIPIFVAGIIVTLLTIPMWLYIVHRQIAQFNKNKLLEYMKVLLLALGTINLLSTIIPLFLDIQYAFYERIPLTYLDKAYLINNIVSRLFTTLLLLLIYIY